MCGSKRNNKIYTFFTKMILCFATRCSIEKRIIWMRINVSPLLIFIYVCLFKFNYIWIYIACIYWHNALGFKQLPSFTCPQRYQKHHFRAMWYAFLFAFIRFISQTDCNVIFLNNLFICYCDFLGFIIYNTHSESYDNDYAMLFMRRWWLNQHRIKVDIVSLSSFFVEP